MEMEQGNRILMIAGGTDGIGFSLLESELRRSKYTQILVLGRSFDFVRKLQRTEVAATGSHQSVVPTVLEIPCDITKLENISAAIAKIDDSSIHDFVLTIGTFSSGRIGDIMPASQISNTNDVVAEHFHLNCISTIHLIRLILPKLAKGDSQILVCTASLAIQARSPYGLQSSTKAALRSFVDTLRIELAGKTRVMNLMPPSVKTTIFSKAGDHRNTENYPPPSRIASVMQYMLDCPFDISIPEILVQQHNFDTE